MMYLGGKVRIAKWVAAEIISRKGDTTRYVEPFLGGNAIWPHLTDHFETAELSDAHLDLILMWQAVQRGWVPPTTITREEYAALKHAEPSALRGFVGFGCSFGGKWFGGYTLHTKKPSAAYPSPPLMAATTSRAVLRSAASLVGASISVEDFRDVAPSASALIYADPPYTGTTGYAGVSFPDAAFWHSAEWWVDEGATVLVSEMRAPSGWVAITSKDRKAFLKDTKSAVREVRTEKLFMHESQVTR